MELKNLVLFGKHPAWSDHMFVSDDSAASHYLKRVFYNHSVIPALQGGEGDKRISETWSFLVFMEDQVFFIVNAISRDSVGRRRFPLIAAYPLPPKLKIEAALEQLRTLKQELRSLLEEMLEAPGDNLNEWQEIVTKKAKSFQSNVAWGIAEEDETTCRLKRPEITGLMSRLTEEHESLDLDSCSFLDACSFIKLGLKQFVSTPPAMLVLDEKENGLGLLFAVEGGSSFELRHQLYNSLTAIPVATAKIPPKVSRLLKSIEASSECPIEVDKVPSLKLSTHHSPINRKIILLGVAAALVIAILFGLFFGGADEEDVSGMDAPETNSMELSAHERWVLNSTAFLEWVQPLTVYADKKSAAIPDFDTLSESLKADLNPFSVVNAKKATIKLAKHPQEHFFGPRYIDKLDAVHSNIDQLRASLAAYYEKQFSEALLKELKRQKYPAPSFIEIDFSKQPLTPDFGPGLVSQLDSYLASRRVLNDLVETTKAFGDSVIRPLYAKSPEHAKYLQRYLQNLIAESETLDEFQGRYTTLLQLFGYPKFISLDNIDTDKLSEKDEWLHLTECEQSEESIKKLVGLLKSHQGSTKRSLLKVTEQKPEKPTLPIKAPTSQVEETVSEAKATLQDTFDPAEWDRFLKNELSRLDDIRLVSEMKMHAQALQSQILENSDIESAQALPKFKDQVAALRTAFKNLTPATLSKAYSNYLEDEQQAQQLSDYMFVEYTAANIDAGDLESLNRICPEIKNKAEAHLAALNESFAAIETSFFTAQTSQTKAKLNDQLSAIAQNPLYWEGLFDSKLQLIQAAIAGDKIVPETASNLIWYVENLTKKNLIDESTLNTITQAFATLKPVEQTRELEDAIHSAFDKYAQTLDPKSLLTVYNDLTDYLSEELHTSDDEGLKNIAGYWSRYVEDKSSAEPSKEELQSLKDSAESPLAQAFYEALFASHSTTNAQSSGSILDKIEQVSGVESIALSSDRSRIEIVFEGSPEKFVFLKMEANTGMTFVQRAPLTLQQYVMLSNICDFDTEYYLTLQDSFWPRAFEVGMGLGYSILREWQFRNRDVFSPIGAFNKKTLPAHLNSPKGILEMADFFGFRLLKPEECLALIRLADESTVKRLELSDVDKENLDSFNTLQSSVYAGKLTQQQAWAGGIDFERGAPGGNQFFDVIGGSSEIAYDGADFYAMGGSWLYAPSALEESVRIEDAERMYIDVGVRFAIDSPMKSYSEQVNKAAIRLLSENK